jgi:hypothetical protein
MGRYTSPMALVLGLALSGCTMMQLYPPGPVVKNFSSSYCLEPQDSPKDCPKSGAKDYTPATDIKLDSALACARETRDLYGEFLHCREDAQMLAGVGIATVAASAAGVAAAGISTAAAASLGASAGAGLGMDYILYNKAKTKAYADATVELQCVIGESEPLQALSLPEVPELSESRYVCPLDPTEILDESQVYPALRAIKHCQEKQQQDTSEINLTIAQFMLAVERERAFGRRVTKRLPTEIDQVVNT